MDDRTKSAWDAEYEGGRYEDEAPVSFVGDILAIVGGGGFRQGLYIGCGNGRNYVPLVAAGLDLIGLDISSVAIDRLTKRMPERRMRLVHGDLSVLPPDQRFEVVIGLQVFQHGDRWTSHSHIRAAQDRVMAGGLFCIRVNSIETDVWPEHERVEAGLDGGFTVRYLEGAKKGLLIHFFSAAELTQLFSESFEEVLPLRRDVTERTPNGPGQWSQWEAIWRKRPDAAL